MREPRADEPRTCEKDSLVARDDGIIFLNDPRSEARPFRHICDNEIYGTDITIDNGAPIQSRRDEVHFQGRTMSDAIPLDGLMLSEPRARPVEPDDLAQLSAALRGASLPTDDLNDPHLRLFAYELRGLVVGYGGLELYGENALLRSIVVAPTFRGQGMGRKIVNALVAHAKGQGVRNVYLLTTNTRDFFAQLGFVQVDRGAAPATVGLSRQMKQLCPATAALMALNLSRT